MGVYGCVKVSMCESVYVCVCVCDHWNIWVDKSVLSSTFINFTILILFPIKVKSGCRVIVIDTSHGSCLPAKEQIARIRASHGNSVDLIVGNIASYDSAMYLLDGEHRPDALKVCVEGMCECGGMCECELSVSVCVCVRMYLCVFVSNISFKYESSLPSLFYVCMCVESQNHLSPHPQVGIGPGSICTTRQVTGHGVPQLTAIYQTWKAVQDYGSKTGYYVPIIADGGIRTSGDIVKSLAVGASAVMLGGVFASTLESPGGVIVKNGKSFKPIRGMGSRSAMEERSGSRGRYHRQGADHAAEGLTRSQKEKVVPEGVEGLVQLKGTVVCVCECVR